MGIHDGHRRRVRELFLKNGIEGMADHAVLELLLFYALPMGDVNPLAHRLIERFGSLSAVLEAPASELVKVEGVGESTAALISLIPQLERRHQSQKEKWSDPVLSSDISGRLLVPRFYGERDEVLYMLCLDSKYKPLSCPLVSRGSVSNASVSVRKVVETALAANATGVILAHNHPSGMALPSREDIQATQLIRSALQMVGVTLLDHLVVADGDYVSMSDNGMLAGGKDA